MKKVDLSNLTPEEFTQFVNTFGDTYNGKGGCINYAKLTGFDKSTISKAMNGVNEVHPVHKFIMRLVKDREDAKNELRKLKKEMSQLKNKCKHCNGICIQECVK